MSKMKCKICGSNDQEVIYRGKIRDGKFGHFAKDDSTIIRCSLCLGAFLKEAIASPEEFYGSDQYRKDVDGDNLVSGYHRNHDSEQMRHIHFTSTANFRNKIIADVGCGAGSFLDLASGMAKETIAIEPNKEFQKQLRARGYKTFDFATDAIATYKERIDQIHCFSVIEHINDPLNFLKDLGELLSKDGQLIISTPNTQDLLLELLPEIYPSFYYRKVHSWYFDKVSFKNLLHRAGFTKVEVLPFQRFGLSNFIEWIRQGKPTGNTAHNFISPTMDSVWRSELENSFRCDYLFARASK